MQTICRKYSCKVLEFIETANLTHYLTSLQQSSSATTMKPKGPTKPPHVMTGFRNKELEAFLESQNIPIGSTINKKTQVVYINSSRLQQFKKQTKQKNSVYQLLYTQQHKNWTVN